MTDILLLDFDLQNSNGDWAAGASDQQHQSLLLLTEKGEWRENPARGVGLNRWVLDEQPENLRAAIKRELEADGMAVLEVSGNVDDLVVDAYYG